MTQITIRRLDQAILDGLKKRAAEAGRSMEEEARVILSDAVLEGGVARQRAGLKRLLAARKAAFRDRVFPDSSGDFRKMRDARTEQTEEWALPPMPRKQRA